VSTWSAFSRFSRTREIAEGVKAMLLADVELRGWTGERIYYGTAVPDFPRPLIVVMLSSESAIQQPSASELEVEARVAVIFAFDESRDVIDGEHDFSSVSMRCDSVLWSNPTVTVEGRDLALRLARAEDFGYREIYEAEEDGELAGTLYPAREYTYVYRRDAATGVPT
jgi:hypothetical protein